jgi:hypothetical protein
MEYKGRVSGGVIVLEKGVSLPEGTEVRVELVGTGAATLGARLMKFAGRAKDLPSDIAENHDHYLHGHSK